MTKNARILFLLNAIALVYLLLFQRSDLVVANLSARYRELTSRPNRLQSGIRPQAVYVPINPPAELDFLPREQVMARRIKAVEAHPDFFIPPYSPNDAVFGQIVDKRPWWGLDGIYFYGPGLHGIDGPSEETRLFLNPYLLVGIIESRAFITNLRPNSQHDSFPRPSELRLNLGERSASVRYDLSGYYDFLKKAGADSKESRIFTLASYNARDFGFNYLSIDMTKAKGVYWLKDTFQPEQVLQYIHCGGSCGYPDGCNNMSPAQTGLNISFYSLPAVIPIKLWRERPQRAEDTADFSYVIEAAAS